MARLAPNKEKLTMQRVVQSGVSLLIDQKTYNQTQIRRKLKTLGFDISLSSLSNILNNKEAGMTTLKIARNGILDLIEKELGYSYNAQKEEYISLPKPDGWQSSEVEEYDENQLTLNHNIQYRPEGRLSIQEKVAFMKTAKSEVVEFGVRLRTFTEYFYSRNEHEFARPILELLENNINFKLYLLDPDCNEAHLYFMDRGLVQEDEKASTQVIKEVMKKMKHLHEEILSKKLKGRFEIYTYKHIPYNHFLITDGAKRDGKMMVSHYMYGIRRANCPVTIINKANHYDLYKRYWDSFKYLTEGARRLSF